MSVLFTNEMAQKILDAINTLNSNLVNARGGALSNLSTTTKSSIIAAINELVTRQGSLSSLSTSVKTNLVAAVNELLNQRGGALSNLSTNSKISIIAAINELVSGQGTLSSLSTSAKNNLVAAINELVNADATINTKLGRFYINNAAAHNSHYRGKNLGTSITAAQMNAVKNGSFDDLYVGDYWPLPIDGTTYAYITGCDIRPSGFPHTGLARKTTHTICVWFQNNNWLFPVNDTDTTEGHLKGSKMYTETLPELLTKIQTVIPDEYFNILEDYIADAANSSGGKTHVVAEAMKLFIPSAYNLGIVDTIALNNTAYGMTDKTLWPYSVHRPQTFGYVCWLSSPASATTWHYKDSHGSYIFHTQTTRDDALYVCPYAYLGIQ